MKKRNPNLLTLLLIFLGSNTAIAQNLQLQWAKAITGTGTVTPIKCASDAAGNLYVAGSFSGTADFDPGPGVANMIASSNGYGNTFFAKYDAQGNYVFAFQLGDSSKVSYRKIAIDNNGNVWLAGELEDSVDFDPGNGVANLVSAGDDDAFAAAYDANGNYISSFNVGGPGKEILYDLRFDASNNLYIAGNFEDTADFDPGAGTTDLTAPVNAENGFIAKYGVGGNLLYAFSIYSGDESDVRNFDVDAAGNLYIGGLFQSSIDLDPGPGTAIFNSFQGIDGYWGMYDAQGNYIRGYTYDGGVNYVNLDANNNFTVSARAAGTMDMDPGTGTANITSQNSYDPYFARYDAQGNYMHSHVFESDSECVLYAVTVNHQGAVIMAGQFEDTTYCIPGNTTTGVLYSDGSFDGFISKFDDDGNFEFAYSFGSTSSELVQDVTTDEQGSLWMVGRFNDTVDFDFGTATTNLVSDVASGGFIVKYTDLQAASVSKIAATSAKAKVYGTDNSVIVDFTALDKVNAEVAVTNMLGQTVARAKHNRNDMLKINLPDAAAQLYVVLISNNGVTCAEKVWVK